MRVLHPDTPAEAVAMLGDAGEAARLCSGSTALQAEWSLGKPRPETLIDIGSFKDLRGLSRSDDGLCIGAGETLTTVLGNPLVEATSPMLQDAIRRVAATSIRNRATLGGNVAWRSGCLVPALLAFDAQLRGISKDGEQMLPLAEWLIAPRAPFLITSIHIPDQPKEGRSGFRKIGLRAAFTPSVISVAGTMVIDDGLVSRARLAVGGGVVPPRRLLATEETLTGTSFTGIDWSAIRPVIAAEIDAPGDVFRSSRYRKRAGANALVSVLTGDVTKGVTGGDRHRPRAASPPDEVRLSRREGGNRWHIRSDLPDKIAAKAPFLTDIRKADMLVGAVLRLDAPHAHILAIKTEKAERLQGVKAVATHRDIEGQNGFGIVFPDQPALCSDKVRYLGDPVAAVAAIDQETAQHALSLIQVEYEQLPIVSDPLEALEPSSEQVHEQGNLVTKIALERGDIIAGFAEAAHIVEETYVTPRQMHGFMETEGGYAEPTPEGGLMVCAGGQHGSRDRKHLAAILAMPEEKIRVVTSPTGGGFGGKDEMTVQPVLALLALKANAPVRLQWTRRESVLAGTKRNPMLIHMRTACDSEGRLLAQEVDLIADSGAYASLSPGVTETAMEHACGPYVTPNVKTRGRLAYTNNGTCGAFRGFGANQMTFAVECQMDRLAALCGLDPVEIRRRNLRNPGAPGFLGQRVASSERLVEMLDAASASPLWREPDDTPANAVTGTGMAINHQGNGLGTIPHDVGAARLILADDGVIEAHFGLDEMGQGLVPSVEAAVADQLGCARADVRPVFGDTHLTPDSGSTSASRGGYVVWKAIELANPSFVEKLKSKAGAFLRQSPDTLKIVPGGLADAASNSDRPLITFPELAADLAEEHEVVESVEFPFPKTEHTEGNARFIFAFGATLARVAVDADTGEVRVLDLELHTAAGPVIDLAAYLGQMEGGLIQGLGFTLSEQVSIKGGRFLTTNLDNYFMPTVRDAPPSMTTFALEDLDPGDPHGPRGVGEIGIGAVTPAIANAVADAIGYWPTKAPFEPEGILDACGARP